MFLYVFVNVCMLCIRMCARDYVPAMLMYVCLTIKKMCLMRPHMFKLINMCNSPYDTRGGGKIDVGFEFQKNGSGERGQSGGKT